MALISFDPEEVIDYVPEYAENRDSDDPCVIKLKYVPFSKIQKYSRMIQNKIKGNSNRGKIAEIEEAIQKKQFLASVESIAGYKIGDREVTDPEEFFNTADTDLIYEVLKAMESTQKLSEGQIKNS